MDYSVVRKKGYEVRGDVLVCGMTDEGVTGPLLAVNQETGGLLRRVTESGEIEGKPLEVRVLHTEASLGSPRLVLVGLGPPSEIDRDVLRKAGGQAARTARDLGASRCVFDLESFCRAPMDHREAAACLAEGSGLGLYRFLKHKTEKKEKKKSPSQLVIATGTLGDLATVRKELEKVDILVEATNMARDLANEPANALTPTVFSKIARELSSRVGLACTVLNREQLKRKRMGGIVAVSAGSTEPPKLVMLRHRPPGGKAPTVALVGKGITFDSGGISLKSSSRMEDMKYDKAGACSVLGVMNAVARLGLPLDIIGLMPVTENLPGGSAYKPGDVVTMYSGKTVEVISTDAEGRMIVADALAYALEFDPDAVFDIATLTGACVIALGAHATGLVSNAPELVEKVEEASARSGERVWEFPNWKEYREQLDSEIADIKNVGGRDGGMITAGLFLREFVGGTPWVHLDIAGNSWVTKDHPYHPKGATGAGVRLLVELLSHWE